LFASGGGFHGAELALSFVLAVGGKEEAALFVEHLNMAAGIFDLVRQMLRFLSWFFGDFVSYKTVTRR
jgi:hypothetical protein